MSILIKGFIKVETITTVNHCLLILYIIVCSHVYSEAKCSIVLRAFGVFRSGGLIHDFCRNQNLIRFILVL